MQHLPTSIQHLFPPGTGGVGFLKFAGQGAEDVAVAVLSSLGGLRVGATGPGVGQAKSDIEFHQTLRQGREVVVQPWRRLGDLKSVADAHHGHIMLFVGRGGRFYAFTDPDSRLYDLGSFPAAMEKLLLGLDFGPALAPDP